MYKPRSYGTTDRPLRTAVVGLGWWGAELIERISASPRFHAVAGVDPSPNRTKLAMLNTHDMRHESTLDGVLGDSGVDAVMLATPHLLHAEQCMDVLASGKELYCEKPLTLKAEDAEKVVETCRRQDQVLGLGHVRRFESAYERVQQILDDGILGQLLFFEANMSHDVFVHVDRSNWRLDPNQAPAGLMTSTGIHLTDLAVCFFGPAGEVRAQQSSIVMEPPVNDFVSASFTFRSGACGVINLLSCTPYSGRVTIFGDKAWVEVVTEGNVDKGRPAILTLCTGTDEPRIRETYEATDTLRQIVDAWAAAISGDEVYRFTYEQAVENIRLFDGIVRSAAADGRRILL
ncbi:MAG: Gfo/Idh/MocA family oxidoreductase [Rhodobacteraceae bacterium]|nr:Gfo/Idh/MocA family oxidoreductase [Paracoccaceae bacterium]MCY4140653.1 Gfo/Idh/MocA family oxidoreductase [Paracoccaceae bacterium]